MLSRIGSSIAQRITRSSLSAWEYVKSPYVAFEKVYAGEENYIQFNLADSFVTQLKQDAISCYAMPDYNWFRLFNPLHHAHFTVLIFRNCYFAGIDGLDRLAHLPANDQNAGPLQSSAVAAFFKGGGAFAGLFLQPFFTLLKLASDFTDAMLFDRLDNLMGAQFKASMQTYLAFYAVFYNVIMKPQQEKHNLIQHSPSDSFGCRIRKSVALSFGHGRGAEGGHLEHEFVTYGGLRRFQEWIKSRWLRVVNPFNVANFLACVIKDGYFGLCDGLDRWRTGNSTMLMMVPTSAWGQFFKGIGAFFDLFVAPVRGASKFFGESLDATVETISYGIRWCYFFCCVPTTEVREIEQQTFDEVDDFHDNNDNDEKKVEVVAETPRAESTIIDRELSRIEKSVLRRPESRAHAIPDMPEGIRRTQTAVLAWREHLGEADDIVRSATTARKTLTKALSFSVLRDKYEADNNKPLEVKIDVPSQSPSLSGTSHMLRRLSVSSPTVVALPALELDVSPLNVPVSNEQPSPESANSNHSASPSSHQAARVQRQELRSAHRDSMKSARRPRPGKDLLPTIGQSSDWSAGDVRNAWNANQLFVPVPVENEPSSAPTMRRRGGESTLSFKRASSATASVGSSLAADAVAVQLKRSSTAS